MADSDPPLERRARDLLDFERDWPAHEGRKMAAIKECFNITGARYYQLLDRVVDVPAARAYDPLTVKRLQRRRAQRARRRTATALGDRTRG